MASVAQEKKAAFSVKTIFSGGGTAGTWTRRIVFYLLLAVIWELLARTGLWPSELFPGSLAVFGALAAGFQNGTFVPAILQSLAHIALGYVISLAIGLVLGVLIGRYRLVEETVGSLVLGLQTLPSVCWLPLAILWFGLTDKAIIFVVMMGALFSITLGVDAGIKNTPPVYLKAARNMGAQGFGLAVQVILPAALPYILTGLKQGWSFAWRSLMAAELLLPYVLSIGSQLDTARDLLDTPTLMAVMLIIIIIGLIVDGLIFRPLEQNVRERWGLKAS